MGSLTQEDRERNRRENFALAQADEAAWVGDKPLWWLSFVDPEKAAQIPLASHRPGGPSFLGVAIVEAVNVIGASLRAWEVGANPGGEMQAYGPCARDAWPEKYWNRLLARRDLAEMGVWEE